VRRPVGIETEYGLNCEGFPGQTDAATNSPSSAVDFGYEASRIVKAAQVPGAFRGWDYERENPYQDLRGHKVDRLARDPHDLQDRNDRSRQLSREELLANTVLLNGARYYNDHNHPEYCTEACLSLMELVAHDRAGERVLYDCEVWRNLELTREFPQLDPKPRVRLLKNNTDYHGRTYGTHENYLFPRHLALETVIHAMIPFFVTRQVYCGAGKVGIETSGGQTQPGFQLSQRADFFEERIGINTTAQRPIFNTRDEPHADKSKYRRLHVIAGDANRSEWATAMKVGTTALVLDLVEDGWRPSLELRDPVLAVKLVSRGHDLLATIELSSGKKVRALDVLTHYYEAAQGRYGGRDEETTWVLGQWKEALDALAGDPAPLADRVDWLAKKTLYDQVRQGKGWEDPTLRRLDLAYHLVDPGLSLFNALEKQGRVRRLVTDDQITAALTSGPTGTRGAVRSLLLRRFGPQIRRLEWDSVTFGSNGREVRIQLDEVAGPLVTRVEQLVQQAPDLEGLFATMNGGRA
jgi:Pup amidohydrolase